MFGIKNCQIISKDDDAPAGCAVSFENEVLPYLKFEGDIARYKDACRVHKKTKQLIR